MKFETRDELERFVSDTNDVNELARLAEGYTDDPESEAPNNMELKGLKTTPVDAEPSDEEKEAAAAKEKEEADAKAKEEADAKEKDAAAEKEKADAEEAERIKEAEKAADAAGKKQDKEPAKEPAKEPDGVATRDGKNFLPYSVLEATRKERAELAEKLEAAMREKAELERKLTGEKTDGEKLDERIAALRERADAAVEQYGEDMGGQFKELYELLGSMYEANKETRKELEAARAAAARSSHEEDDSDVGEIRAAIDATPAIAAWEARGDAWWQRAVSTYKTAMDADPEFAKLSIAERFAQLPDKVQAVYGRDPELPKPEVKAPDETKNPAGAGGKDAAPAKASEPKERVPLSSSDIPGGAADEPSPFGPLANMSAAAMTAHFENMEPDKLASVLKSLS